MTFDEWMKTVDNEISKHFGLSSQDLPDWTYADAFEDGYTPEDAAQEAMSAAIDF